MINLQIKTKLPVTITSVFLRYLPSQLSSLHLQKHATCGKCELNEDALVLCH